MKVSCVMGLSYGDESKAKVAFELARKGNYSIIARAFGGSNCGHSIYLDDKLYKLHQLPCGVLINIPSVIGAGCVVNPEKLFREIDELEKEGFDVAKNVKIAYNAQVVQQKHIDEDIANDKIGSTGQGISPCYVDMWARKGQRVEDELLLREFVCDTYELFDDNSNILVEGAQGVWLDIMWGNYPFVSSSCSTSAYLYSLGVSPRDLDKVYGVIKSYDTYVGTYPFQPDGEIFNKLADIGGERGTTTGRVRKCNFLNLTKLLKAIKMNGVNFLIMNKMDILAHPEINTYKMIINNEILDLENEDNFKTFLRTFIPKNIEIVYSYSAKEI